MTTLSTQYGELKVFYDDLETIKHFCFEDQIYPLQFVLVNQQPAHHIKKIEKKIKELREKDLIYYKVVEKELHIQLDHQEVISLKIKILPNMIKSYELDQNLKISGLKKMLCKEFNWESVKVCDSKGELGTLEATSKTLRKCTQLKSDQILILENIKTKEDKTKRKIQDTASSLEYSGKIFKFINFQSAPDWLIDHPHLRPGLNLIGKCQMEGCKLGIQCVNLGFSKDKAFDIKKSYFDIKCCGSPYINSCALLNSSYELVDGKTENGTSTLEGFRQQVKRLNLALAFYPSTENMQEWKTLKIKVTTLDVPAEIQEVQSSKIVVVGFIAGMCAAFILGGIHYYTRSKK